MSTDTRAIRAHLIESIVRRGDVSAEVAERTADLICDQIREQIAGLRNEPPEMCIKFAASGAAACILHAIPVSDPRRESRFTVIMLGVLTAATLATLLMTVRLSTLMP
jgi:hypothetical protein